MAKITNAYDTYSATTNREALANTIFNLDPTATPFMSAIGTKNVSNVTFDWSTENLPSISATGELEGFGRNSCCSSIECMSNQFSKCNSY